MTVPGSFVTIAGMFPASCLHGGFIFGAGRQGCVHMMAQALQISSCLVLGASFTRLRWLSRSSFHHFIWSFDHLILSPSPLQYVWPRVITLWIGGFSSPACRKRAYFFALAFFYTVICALVRFTCRSLMESKCILLSPRIERCCACHHTRFLVDSITAAGNMMKVGRLLCQLRTTGWHHKVVQWWCVVCRIWIRTSALSQLNLERARSEAFDRGVCLGMLGRHGLAVFEDVKGDTVPGSPPDRQSDFIGRAYHLCMWPPTTGEFSNWPWYV